MRPSVRRLSALVAVAALSVAGCGGSGQTEDQAGDRASDRASDRAADRAGGSSPSPSATAEAVEIELEIENGEVSPSGERVDVEVGQTIRFVVDSDVADEIHVHSSPEHTFAFKAGVDDQEFEFTLQRPGVVEAELHELGDVVVTLAARP